MLNVESILLADGSWILNKTIARKVGIVAAALLADLVSKRKYFKNREELRPDGSFYNTRANLMADLGIGRHALSAAKKALIDAGFLVIVKKTSVWDKDFFLVNDSTILSELGAGNQPREGAGNQPQIIIHNTNKNKANSYNSSSMQNKGTRMEAKSTTFYPSPGYTGVAAVDNDLKLCDKAIAGLDGTGDMVTRDEVIEIRNRQFHCRVHLTPSKRYWIELLVNDPFLRLLAHGPEEPLFEGEECDPDE